MRTKERDSLITDDKTDTQSDDVRTLSPNSNSNIDTNLKSKPCILEDELKVLEGAGRTPRRVKVYLLNGDDWIDNGTGFCIEKSIGKPDHHIFGSQ